MVKISIGDDGVVRMIGNEMPAELIRFDDEIFTVGLDKSCSVSDQISGFFHLSQHGTEHACCRCFPMRTCNTKRGIILHQQA